MLRDRARATTFLALTFLCGVLSGTVGANLWHRMVVSADAARPAVHTPPTPAEAAANHKRILDWFTKKLNLTPDQVQQLTPILDETRGEYHQQEMQIESIRQESNTRIRALLTEQQKPLFDELLRERAANEDRHQKH